MTAIYWYGIEKTIIKMTYHIKANINAVHKNTDTYTVKPMNKGHPRERQNMVLQTSGLYLEVTLFYFIKEGLLKCGLHLHVGLYLEVTFNTGLTVFGIYMYILYWSL